MGEKGLEHYLDNSATTVVSPSAAEKAFKVMTEIYGNPSSLHTKGIEAEKELEQARLSVAERLGAQHEEIFFTSGGTEANNLAVFGAAEAKKRSGKRIVVSSAEHSSVLEAAKHLEQNGWDVVYIAPCADGTISPDDVAEQVDKNTTLVSVMYVNNETGAINPVDEIFELARLKNPDIICHTDAVQAFGKLEIKAKKLGLHFSGTGDIFSAFVTSECVNGTDVFTAVQKASAFIEKAIELTDCDKNLHYNADGIDFEQLICFV